ncbi:MAG: peptidylprolyl isomerase [bacterium]
MSVAIIGDRVRVHYTGWLADGTVFDTTAQRGPLEFTIGDDSVAMGFAEAVVGMNVGQKKSVELQPKKAFGSRSSRARATIDMKDLPGNLQPYEGQHLRWTRPDGQIAQVTVLEVKKFAVVVDTNHPLAGKTVKFEIELVGIVG